MKLFEKQALEKNLLDYERQYVKLLHDVQQGISSNAKNESVKLLRLMNNARKKLGIANMTLEELRGLK